MANGQPEQTSGSLTLGPMLSLHTRNCCHISPADIPAFCPRLKQRSHPSSQANSSKCHIEEEEKQAGHSHANLAPTSASPPGPLQAPASHKTVATWNLAEKLPLSRHIQDTQTVRGAFSRHVCRLVSDLTWNTPGDDITSSQVISYPRGGVV